ncbi:hypothetical protein JCM19294_927 [Nonlabens tegetincola]|uniref:Uncharacterized protein n=1 Tax=Nonlabens tegetincola TaxID=323273 RepID=A0A090Q948_9FLAO|nr:MULTISPECIES: hypothetical protein [Nonlabens]GAK98293.1 hypothetical protein JCM19294_927 [Nonlabens tegetincola]
MKEEDKNFASRLEKELKSKNTGEKVVFKISYDISKKLIGYHGILLDLNDCRKYLEEMGKIDSEVVQNSLFISFVITYGKSFTDRKFSKLPKLEESIFQDQSYFDHHKELMNARHNFVAHRGISNYELGESFFELHVNKMQYDIQSGISKTFKVDHEVIPHYRKLIDFLIKRVTEKTEIVRKKIADHLLESLLSKNYSKKMKTLNHHDIKIVTDILNSKK